MQSRLVGRISARAGLETKYGVVIAFQIMSSGDLNRIRFSAIISLGELKFAGSQVVRVGSLKSKRNCVVQRT